jgi:catechol 2,3-dioxygenase-like lactoylglutathione lyase family enzyme
MQIKSLDHLHIYAANAELSAQFYIAHFDATFMVENKNNNGDTRIFLSLGGQVLVLGDFPKGLGPKALPAAGDGAYAVGHGISHFGLRVGDVEAALEELRQADVDILSLPVTEESGLTYAYISAPDGVVIELTQYGADAT